MKTPPMSLLGGGSSLPRLILLLLHGHKSHTGLGDTEATQVGRVPMHLPGFLILSFSPEIVCVNHSFHLCLQLALFIGYKSLQVTFSDLERHRALYSSSNSLLPSYSCQNPANIPSDLLHSLRVSDQTHCPVSYRYKRS